MLNVSIIYIERGVTFYVLSGEEQNKLSKDDIWPNGTSGFAFQDRWLDIQNKHGYLFFLLPVLDVAEPPPTCQLYPQAYYPWLREKNY